MKTMSFLTIIILEVMLTQIFLTYGPIKPMDLNANCECLTAPWIPGRGLHLWLVEMHLWLSSNCGNWKQGHHGCCCSSSFSLCSKIKESPIWALINGKTNQHWHKPWSSNPISRKRMTVMQMLSPVPKPSITLPMPSLMPLSHLSPCLWPWPPPTLSWHCPCCPETQSFSIVGLMSSVSVPATLVPLAKDPNQAKSPLPCSRTYKAVPTQSCSACTAQHLDLMLLPQSSTNDGKGKHAVSQWSGQNCPH